jgi:hypothetical protein
MLKKLMLASALVAGSAYAQQNTDISGTNFQSGKADAALAELGRKAAASGSKLVITAPPDWHAKIAAKVRAGGKADIVLRDGFYENVLVRVQDTSAPSVVESASTANADVAKSKAEAAKARAEADKMKAEAEKARAEAEIAKAEAEKARAEAETMKAHAQAATAAAARPATPAPAPKPVAQAPAAAPDSNVDAIRSRMQESLNGGRDADGSLTVAMLQSGDMLYAEGPVKAVMRREGNRRLLYWLEDDLDLRRSELKAVGNNQYQVMAVVRGEGVLRQEFPEGSGVLDASEPAADSAQRLALEKNLNDGHTVDGTVEPAGLRNGDAIYTDGNAALVVRRQGRDFSRYWLVGALDLTQTGVKADGANKYKVMGDTVQ